MNIVLITLDTVRCSHFGCYGYEHNTTPNLDKFSEKCLIGQNTFTVAPVTLTAHASILSSLYPFQHGVRDNGGYALGEDVPTLTKLLKKKGYKTGAFVGSFVLDGLFGLDKGFETYDDTMTMDMMNSGVTHWAGHRVEKWERRANEVTDSATKWLDKHMSNDFFMWVHYFDCHTPYNPPMKFKGVVKSETSDYDNELRYVDYEVGRFLKYLEHNNLMDDTMIVIVGDHGEAFGEYEEKGHGMHLYDTTLKVPLLVYKPRGKQSWLNTRTTVLDVAPTILSHLGIEKPEHMCGDDLYSLRESGIDRDFYAETFYRTRMLEGDYAQAIYSGDTKYIKYSLSGWYSRDGDYLIECGSDSAFEVWLQNFIDYHKENVWSSKKPDEDEKIIKERLRSLGYIQ